MLTKRLQKIVSAIPECQTLADVGCDHGYVGIAALKSGRAQHVVFTDISAPSLSKAKINLPSELSDRASFVCRNGLGNIVADCAVIAGMGGLEIMSVLVGADTLPEFLVLQPMKNQYELRRFLLAEYNIVADELFFDGKFYDLIAAKRRCGERQQLTETELRFGKDNLRCPSQDFRLFIRREQEKYNTILQQCSDADVVARLERIDAVAAVIQEEGL